jgi:hypothetical protein
VTPSAMATRLLNLGLIAPAPYNRWRNAWDKFQREHPPRESGFASPVDKALGRNGPTFTSLVLEALSAERIPSATAARYLNLGYPHIEELQRRVSLGR